MEKYYNRHTKTPPGNIEGRGGSPRRGGEVLGLGGRGKGGGKRKSRGKRRLVMTTRHLLDNRGLSGEGGGQWFKTRRQ